METLLKRWLAIPLSIGAVLSMLWGGYSFASERFNGAVDARVKTKVAEILDEMQFAEVVKKRDFEGLERKFNGVQEQVNKNANSGSAIQKEIEEIRRQNKSVDDKLNIIINRLIAPRQ
ncbi:MAG: hypothetical protein GY807_21155 [Gammaproteobacteria bacterium]|nr:hypothetical protein [Gammaproteobacteria bacterium]